MIRLRIPVNDDLHLYRIIMKRLLPLAQVAEPKLRMSRKSIYMRLRKSKVFVSVREGKPFGFISLKIKQTVLFIDLLAVEASATNRGWGSRLMTIGERYGKKMGCVIARIFVDQDNEHALAFYEKKGYHIQEFVPLVHCYLLQKSL